jgi:galactokinase
MDQLASMLCEAGHALLIDCGTATSSAVPLDPSGANLQVVVVDTGVRHELVDGRYAARRSQCEQAARELGVPSLSVLTDGGELGVLSDELLRRRARHVINENQRVRQFVALLRAGRLADCGGLLSASHASLRDDFEVSWPAADVAVTAALAAGALGARMTGGGFGGSVLVLLPADRLVDVTTSVSDSLAAARAAGDGAPQFLAVLPGPGAVQVWPPPDNAAQSSDC